MLRSRAARLAKLEASVPMQPSRPKLPLSDPAARLFFRGFSDLEIDMIAEVNHLPTAEWPASHQSLAARLLGRVREQLQAVLQLLAADEIGLTEPPLLPHVYSFGYGHADLVRWFEHWLLGACEYAKLPWPQSLEQLAEYVEGAIGDTATTSAAEQA